MKLFILCFLISLPVFAQEVKDTPNNDTDQAKPSLPQNSEQEQKQEEEQEFLGPYDREGNYKVQIKKPEDEQNSD